MFTSAPRKLSFNWKQTGLTLAALALTASPVAALAQAKVVSSVSAAVAKSSSRGPIAPSTDLRVTIWLATHNKADFDKKVEALYTPGSPTFHKWLSTDELMAYAPTASEVKQVKEELTRQGLTVIEDGRDNFSISAHGPAEKVQSAFHTRIEEFERAGKTFHANTTEATFEGESASLVQSIAGLSNLGMKPQIAYVKDPKTGKARAPRTIPAKGSADFGLQLFTDECFTTPTTFTYGTSANLPVGVYFGNVYDNTARACGYTPAQMQQVYGLSAAYKAGISGQGQTIVIVDAYGSTTIQSDTTNFNSRYGLPAFTSSSFKVIYPTGKPLDPQLGLSEGWNVETSLDVEWSHAIAPQANIVLLAAAGEDDQDLQYAVEYATSHKLGNVISNSYGSPEIEDGQAALNAYNDVIERAAAAGISVNYATGDGGDLGLDTPVGAASVPADSPYATAVGGTSIGVPGGAGSAKETGWGNNQTEIAASPTSPLDPPYSFGNVGGAGGGQSVYFKKPAYQKALPGSYRLLPDVAMEADPYTGAIIFFTDSPSPEFQIESIGGTSLSTPMFSAMWALADQKAGHSLGQAAPILSKLTSSALNDIVPVNSTTNVTGTVIDSSGATFYSADALAAPLEGTTEFYSAVWPINGYGVNLTFGTDTSLHTTKGWDDVTGYGTPKGLAFITAAAKE
jgi:subtilase family serine protease